MEDERGLVLGYYLLTLTDDIEALQPGDYYTILKYQIYKELPFIYTKILFRSLSAYRSEANGGQYQSNFSREKIDVNDRNRKTGYFVWYSVPLDTEIGMTTMPDSVYIHFFEHYVHKVNEYYYGSELNNPRAHTSPLQRYKADVLYLYKVMSWYIGDEISDKYICIYTDTFFTYLDKSKYLTIISAEDKEKARQYAKDSLEKGVEDEVYKPRMHK